MTGAIGQTVNDIQNRGPTVTQQAEMRRHVTEKAYMLTHPQVMTTCMIDPICVPFVLQMGGLNWES